MLDLAFQRFYANGGKCAKKDILVTKRW